MSNSDPNKKHVLFFITNIPHVLATAIAMPFAVSAIAGTAQLSLSEYPALGLAIGSLLAILFFGLEGLILSSGGNSYITDQEFKEFIGKDVGFTFFLSGLVFWICTGAICLAISALPFFASNYFVPLAASGVILASLVVKLVTGRKRKTDTKTQQ